MIIDSNKIPPLMGGSAVKVLCHLAVTGPCRMTDIADAAGFSTAACTGLIDRLERDGLAHRVHSREDRRVILIDLTRRGVEKVESLKPEPEVAIESAPELATA